MRMAKDFAPYAVPALQVRFEQARTMFEITDADPSRILFPWKIVF